MGRVQHAAQFDEVVSGGSGGASGYRFSKVVTAEHSERSFGDPLRPPAIT